jgi:hypothetical protein
MLDFSMCFGFAFIAFGVICMITTLIVVPFFFVVGIVFFLFGVGVVKVPNLGKYREEVIAAGFHRSVKKVPVKKVIPKGPDSNIECEEELIDEPN